MKTFLIAAMSLDGYISPADSVALPSTSWTSAADHQFFVMRTKQARALVVGLKTLMTFPRGPLADRINIVYSHDLAKVKNFLQTKGWDGEVVALNAQTAQLTADKVYVTDAAPTELVTWLDKLGLPELAVCGGQSVYNLFLRSGVIDTLYLTIEPVVFGAGIKLFDQAMFDRLKLKNVSQLSEQTLLLEYQLESHA